MFVEEAEGDEEDDATRDLEGEEEVLKIVTDNTHFQPIRVRTDIFIRSETVLPDWNENLSEEGNTDGERERSWQEYIARGIG